VRGTSSGGSTGATSTSVSLLSGGRGGGWEGGMGIQEHKWGVSTPPPVLSRGFWPKLFLDLGA